MNIFYCAQRAHTAGDSGTAPSVVFKFDELKWNFEAI